MLARFFSIAFLVVSAHAAIASSAQSHVVQSNQQIRPLAPFTGVKVSGRVSVGLHTGYAKSQVILRGDPRDLVHVVTKVANGTLHLTIQSAYPRYGQIQADINTRNLNAFEYKGAGEITGYQLRTSLLDVTLKNQGKTTLQGQIGLRRLVIAGDGYTEISGINSPNLSVKLSGKPKVKLAGIVNLTSLDLNNDGWLSMYWVKSKTLTIRSHGKSFLQLGGVVGTLDVELWNSSHFNGRYIRADRAFVKTHDRAVAEMSAVKHQHTLATDSSDIQFYNIPGTKADFMADAGAVLDMRDLSMPHIQEYNQYNK